MADVAFFSFTGLFDEKATGHFLVAVAKHHALAVADADEEAQGAEVAVVLMLTYERSRQPNLLCLRPLRGLRHAADSETHALTAEERSLRQKKPCDRIPCVVGL